MTPAAPRLPRLDEKELTELENVLGDLARVPRTRYTVPGRVVDGERTHVVRQGERPWEAPAGTRALEVLDQLATTGSRQARLGAGSKTTTPAHARPLPYVDNALDVLGQITGLLATWATATHRRDLDEWEAVAKAATNAGRTEPPRPTGPRSLNAADAADYLYARIPALTRRPGSTRPELDALHRLVRRSRAMVDRTPDRWYAGPCSTPRRFPDGGLVIDNGEQAYCDEDLYARPHIGIVKCRDCGAEHKVEARRAELLRLARERLEDATTISRALGGLGQEVKAERIRQWKARGRIVPHGLDAKGNPLYRVGDVMDLLAADAARAARPRKARAA